MASREDNIATVCEFHRIEGTSLAQLRALHHDLGATAFKEVTLTGTSFEGGGGTGQITFPATDYLAALQRMIRLLDPAVPPPLTPQVSVSAAFGHRMIQT
ncbi:MAG: hypothetical protein LBK76_03480 [Verrucomicrobiales bacterium]|jgi:hypothetical protein|nr:hypothetical protein [Verrucomicrobiales bacterium]